jgi:methionyl-tRNA formyltransferase
MIVKLDKNVSDLKIGLVGSRSACFAKTLKARGIKFQHITSDDIDETYDLVFESGVYHIIPESVLAKPLYGVIGTHETPLPEGKGWAPIQWSVLNNRKNLTITLYKLDGGVDSGEIINQVNVPILKHDTLDTLNKKRENGISQSFQLFLDELEQGYIVLRDQTGAGSYHKRRSLSSCELDPTTPLIDLWDEIRICDNDEYPAFFLLGNKKVILRYEVLDEVTT